MEYLFASRGLTWGKCSKVTRIITSQHCCSFVHRHVLCAYAGVVDNWLIWALLPSVDEKFSLWAYYKVLIINRDISFAVEKYHFVNLCLQIRNLKADFSCFIRISNNHTLTSVLWVCYRINWEVLLLKSSNSSSQFGLSQSWVDFYICKKLLFNRVNRNLRSKYLW